MSLQYIIDGYNLLRHPLVSPASKPSLSPTENLVLFISRRHLTGSEKNTVVIVFDGFASNASVRYPSCYQILFSQDISADEKIKRLVEVSAMPKRIVVVSDDREIQSACRVYGVRIESIPVFLKIGEIKHGARKRSDENEKANCSDMERINRELRKKWGIT